MTAENDSFLGVERSLKGRKWVRRASDDRIGLALSQRLGLPDVIGQLLVARGHDLDTAEGFLDPRIRDQMPDPLALKDMEKAVERIVTAVTQSETIAIFGDYDVDGATSAALLTRFFEAVGVRVVVYVPDRQKEGYGPNTAALLELGAQGAGVIVTVDCGTTAYEPLAAAAEAGLDVIVVDHHVAEPHLPTALAVINPNRLDDPSPHGQMAAVGVTFLLVVAVNTKLRETGWYSNRPAPNLLRWLDLVALGTVCDVVPLTGINRALVTQGIKVMARRDNIGLAALSDVAGVSEAPEAYHLGFIFGPRINAGGRVGESSLGAELLSTDDALRATELARQLDTLNLERRGIEARCLAEAIEQAEAGGVEDGLVYVSSEGWHVGVIGIVAGRLKERYDRPACVVARDGGVGKGSGRSIPGVDLGATVIAARQAGLLTNGGGHAMAAGFTVEQARESEFRTFLSGRISEAVGLDGIVASLRVDGALQPVAATAEFALTLSRIAPFGSGNAEPRFVLPAARIVRADVVGADHVRCIVSGEGGGSLKAIAFRSLEEPLGQALLARGAPLHLAGHVRVDRWQGRENVQFIIEDAATAH
jgi:single-stranded-DNA-specific exonuclease